MAGLSYYLRGAGDDTAKKTVVVRFRHNGNFDRATEAKVAKKDFDADAGLVKVKVDGAAELNKEINFVRSRFLDVLSQIENGKLELNLDTFKVKYLTSLTSSHLLGRLKVEHQALNSVTNFAVGSHCTPGASAQFSPAHRSMTETSARSSTRRGSCR